MLTTALPVRIDGEDWDAVRLMIAKLVWAEPESRLVRMALWMANTLPGDLMTPPIIVASLDERYDFRVMVRPTLRLRALGWLAARLERVGDKGGICNG